MEQKSTSKKMKQSLKIRLLVAELFVFLIFAAIVFIFLCISNQNVSDRLSDQAGLIKYANQYRIGSKNLTSSVRSYAATGEKEFYDAYYEELNETKNRDTALEGMDQIGLSEKELAYIDEISGYSNNLVPLEEAAMEQVSAGNLKEAIEAVFGSDYETVIQKINSKTEEMIGEIDTRAGEAAVKAQRRASVCNAAFIISLLLVVACTFQIITFVRKELLRPVIKVSEQMDFIAAGELSEAFSLTADESEIGKMAASIHKTKDILQRIIGEISGILLNMAGGDFDQQVRENYVGYFSHIKDSLEKIILDMNQAFRIIRQSSGLVRNGAEQMAATAQNLASGTMEQTRSIKEISDTVNSLSDALHIFQNQAREAYESSEKIGGKLVTGSDNMKQLKELIAGLNVNSSEIHGIVKTIDDISFQTNILALNATVEAARAGETGKGFAVVAGEVKSLAMASQEAAKNTAELIEKTIQMIGEGTKYAEITASNMEEIRKDTLASIHTIKEMAGEAAVQANAVKGINEAVSRVSDVVENNSAAAEQMAASSEEQNAQAQLLSETISRFHISESKGDIPNPASPADSYSPLLLNMNR